MPTSRQLALAIGLAVIFIAGLIAYFLIPEPEIVEEVVVEEVVVEAAAEPEPTTEVVIGQSVEGRDITAVAIGGGETDLLFVGGIHGGYEWNSTLLAYEMIDHFIADPSLIPADITVHIIPDLNPDGTALALNDENDGRFAASNIHSPFTRLPEGRFNANDVDLNRNFDCKWAPESTWRGEVVSAGTAAFSEPEAVALRDYVLATTPDAAVFWHAKANNVYASECEAGVLPATLTLMSTYAAAADYGEVPVFDAYPITGDAEGWLASINIPAVTVELETHNSIEWTRNLAGVKAVLDLYSRQAN